MSINKRIKSIIEEKGLTIDTFASLINEKPQRVKDVLRGKQKAPQEMLINIVSKLNVDGSWLLSGNIPPKTPPQVNDTRATYSVSPAVNKNDVLDAWDNASPELQAAALRVLNVDK